MPVIPQIENGMMQTIILAPNRNGINRNSVRSILSGSSINALAFASMIEPVFPRIIFVVFLQFLTGLPNNYALLAPSCRCSPCTIIRMLSAPFCKYAE